MKLNAPTFSKRRLVVTLAAMAGLALAAPAQAQGSYPNKPIRIVVPVPAGGAADTLARIIGERLTAKLGNPSSSKTVSAQTAILAPTTLPAPRPMATPSWFIALLLQ